MKYNKCRTWWTDDKCWYLSCVIRRPSLSKCRSSLGWRWRHRLFIIHTTRYPRRRIKYWISTNQVGRKGAASSKTTHHPPLHPPSILTAASTWNRTWTSATNRSKVTLIKRKTGLSRIRLRKDPNFICLERVVGSRRVQPPDNKATKRKKLQWINMPPSMSLIPSKTHFAQTCRPSPTLIYKDAIEASKKRTLGLWIQRALCTGQFLWRSKDHPMLTATSMENWLQRQELLRTSIPWIWTKTQQKKTMLNRIHTSTRTSRPRLSQSFDPTRLRNQSRVNRSQMSTAMDSDLPSNQKEAGREPTWWRLTQMDPRWLTARTWTFRRALMLIVTLEMELVTRSVRASWVGWAKDQKVVRQVKVPTWSPTSTVNTHSRTLLSIVSTIQTWWTPVKTKVAGHLSAWRLEQRVTLGYRLVREIAKKDWGRANPKGRPRSKATPPRLIKLMEQSLTRPHNRWSAGRPPVLIETTTTSRQQIRSQTWRDEAWLEMIRRRRHASWTLHRGPIQTGTVQPIWTKQINQEFSAKW